MLVVQIVGLVAPTSYLWGKYIAAGQHFGLPELQEGMPGADRLAWAAYRSGNFASAARWPSGR